MTVSTRKLLALAESWLNACESTLMFWPPGESGGLKLLLDHPPAVAGCMACALELRDALISEPDFGQALADLGLEPVQQNTERP
jgi:hypothetical protein